MAMGKISRGTDTCFTWEVQRPSHSLSFSIGFLLKLKENGSCDQSYPVRYGGPSSELNLVFASSGEPHPSVFLPV